MFLELKLEGSEFIPADVRIILLGSPERIAGTSLFLYMPELIHEPDLYPETAQINSYSSIILFLFWHK